MRGVCALNFEAMSLLNDPQGEKNFKFLKLRVKLINTPLKTNMTLGIHLIF